MSEELESGAAVFDADEAADLGRLSAMVAADTGEAAPAVDEVEAAPAVDAAESMGAFLTLASGALALAGFKRAAAVWAPDVCQEAAGRIVPVLRKYPWGGRVLAFFETGAGAEELALGAFMVPVAIATAGAVRADLAEARQKTEPPKAETRPAPAGDIAGPGETMREVHGHANE